jgi:ATP-binding cassette, subfamily B, bacterial PglK
MKLRAIIELLNFLGLRRKMQLGILAFLMMFSSFVEMLSVGAVMPVLGILTQSTGTKILFNIDPSYFYWGDKFSSEVIVIFLFAIIVIASAIFRLFVNYLVIKVSYRVGTDISYSMFYRSLSQPYEYHILNDSSNLISTIITKTNITVSNVVLPLLMLVSSIFTCITLSTLIFILIYHTAIVPVIILSAVYFVLLKFTKVFAEDKGKITSENADFMMRTLSDGFGGIKNIILTKNAEFYSQKYKEFDHKYRKATGDIIFIGSSPRYIIETISVLLLIYLAYHMSMSTNGLAGSLPLLGALVYSVQKILPVAQSAYNSAVSIFGGLGPLNDVVKTLTSHISGANNTQRDTKLPISFKLGLELRDVSYRYPSGCTSALNGKSMKIQKGEFIGIVGKSGSGKSTLVDLLVGLLNPQEGMILLDDRETSLHNNENWFDLISYTPQSIFLFDGTVAQNITGFAEKIDEDLLNFSIEFSMLTDDLMSMPDGVDSQVGESGKNVSGGQRQRIGIAQAIYRNKEILIFDESTNAVDSPTEELIFANLSKLKGQKTIIFITHNKSLVSNFDSLIEF